MTLAAKVAPDLPHHLSGSLEGVAHELDLLQTHVLRMQDVCGVRALGGDMDSAVIRELQGLDLLSQRLGGLSGFVRAVIAGLPFDSAMTVEAGLAAVTLQDMAHRLGAHAVGREAPAEVDESGDFDLF